jgi:hypothetical protein
LFPSVRQTRQPAAQPALTYDKLLQKLITLGLG